ncbi:MAG: chemotaxis response regulator protein-glutamate methylesterase [Candidatus Hinthialibacter antarcticus]|nr:chemotaxis response regulator protein-glutamate methylesterase [Candidatus Hinthialibacter antarcticus]
MRIGIVNDSTIAVEALRRLLQSKPDYDVAWIANDGKEAVQRTKEDKPDILLMDLVMPVMDGAQATRQIMRESPCAIIVVTGSVDSHVSKVFEALGNGALDAVATPVIGADGGSIGSQEFFDKLERIRKFIKGAPTKTNIEQHPDQFSLSPDAPRLVLIGASTGGPKAIAQVISHLPEDFNAAILIVQHVDSQFSEGLAKWLDDQTSLSVKTAKEGDWIEPRRIYLAGSEEHLVISHDHRLVFQVEPTETPYRPSIDVLFTSAAQRWDAPGAAVLLSGMGKDGAAGLLALRQAGWHTIAQDEATCVVYGMPKAAVALGAAVEELPLDQIASSLVNQLRISFA